MIAKDITYEDIINAKEAITHDGRFHADDVFGAALLLIVNRNIKIKRTRMVPDDFTGIVFDVGRGLFDHHQKNKRVREDGTPYAAFGLLFEKIGPNIMNPEDAINFDENFIKDMDLSDNTGSINEMSNIISSMNPFWDEKDIDMDLCFEEAVQFATKILDRKIKEYASRRKAFSIVKEQIKKSEEGILELNEGMPWRTAVLESEINFVIIPRKGDDGIIDSYTVQPVLNKNNKNSHDYKIPFPVEWEGLENEELEEKSEIKGLIFCHSSGFMCVCDSYEAAEETVNKATLAFYK